MKDIEKIMTRGDFVAFVNELSQDFISNQKSWQNTNVDAFISALGAWVEDLEGYYKNSGQPFPDSPDWKMIANMLMAAKIYQ